jgi:hypothetical protein
LKIVIPIIVAIGLSSVVATLYLGNRLAEEKVTPHPFETGLKWDAEQRTAAKVDCAVSQGPCTKDVAGVTVTLEIGPRPVRFMTDLLFEVRARRGGAPLAGATASISLSMPGMYMGENGVALSAGEPGSYRGKGVIVRCPSGRRVWSAQVNLAPAGDAEPVSATFTFEVEA